MPLVANLQLPGFRWATEPVLSAKMEISFGQILEMTANIGNYFGNIGNYFANIADVGNYFANIADVGNYFANIADIGNYFANVADIGNYGGNDGGKRKGLNLLFALHHPAYSTCS
jgi:hypothetical protein